QAQFYLEANNWNLNEALSNYIEEPMGDVEQEAAESGPFQGTQDSVPSNATSGSSKQKRSRVATLRDLDNEVSEEEEEEERENLFAGGEKSGIFTQNPNAKSPKPSNSLVSDILKKAAEGGRGPAEEPEVPDATPRSFFTGT
ncbi:4680_t:CDS:2, partial [Acaulospora morrowiae]